MGTRKKILIVDDDKSQLEILSILLSEKGFEVLCAEDGERGLNTFSSQTPEIVILDWRLPDSDGLTVLQKMKLINSKAKIIVATAYHDMEKAVHAIKYGAHDYVTKPIDLDSLYKAVEAFVPTGETEKVEADDPLSDYESSIHILGVSRQMQEVLKAVGALCDADVTVLIEGETGTGKELVAKALHYYGSRRSSPFLTIDCSATVPTLFESEIFGHEKGAFTGALDQKKGLLEIAENGTVFFDEIGMLPMEVQGKVLRFLQFREFRRVGGSKLLKSEARIIAATNENLRDMVEMGKFKADLYYRLNVVKISIPPLRERKEDIGILARHFLKKACIKLKKREAYIEKDALKRLEEHSWPGNVRELENVIMKAVICSKDDLITEGLVVSILNEESGTAVSSPIRIHSLREVEKAHIKRALKATGGNITRAAQLLGISRPTLRKRIKDL